MTFPKPYDPLEQSNMIMAYGLPPSDESPRIPSVPYKLTCIYCGADLPLIGTHECTKQGSSAAMFTIDPPPPYAATNERKAIDALDILTPEEASRVLTYACSRFGVPGPVMVEIGKQFRVSKRQEKLAAESAKKRKASP